MKYTPTLSHSGKLPKLNKTTVNLWFDITLLALFVMTGVTAYIDKQLHKMFGIGTLVAVLLHLWLHWHWITAIGSRVRQLKPNVRLKVSLDLGMLLVFCLLICSGLIIMVIWAPVVSEFHELMFFAFVAFVAVHLGLHRKWLSRQIKRRLSDTQHRARNREA